MAIKIAQSLGTEILSFDSRQFYRELKIGSAPPSDEELKLVRHHFIMDRSVIDDLNAAAYAEEAFNRIQALFETYDQLIMVGGSGMYLQALVEGFDDIPPTPPELREALNQQMQEEGLSALVHELKLKDPDYYEQVDRANPQRVIRALEVIRHSQKTYSSFRKRKKKELPFAVEQYALEEDRAQLYERINQRVDLMIEAGLEAEAYSLKEHAMRSSLQTVGYREFFAYFEGELSKEACIEEIKKNSRRYAKRQFTWFRRKPEIRWFHREDANGLLNAIHA